MAGVPAAAVKTTLTELDGSRVRLRVEVPADELEGRLTRKAHELGRDLKLPGFRRGKVPAGLVIQRIGRDAVLEQAVRETLPRWYSDAIESSGIVPVGDPQVSLDEMPPLGKPLAFSIEVGVLPRAQLGSWRGLEGPAARERRSRRRRVETEVEAVRDRLARLESVDRAAELGDFVIVDYEGTFADDGGEAGGDAPGAGASRFPWRRGPRSARRARRGEVDPRLRGGARRRLRGREAASSSCRSRPGIRTSASRGARRCSR